MSYFKLPQDVARDRRYCLYVLSKTPPCTAERKHQLVIRLQRLSDCAVVKKKEFLLMMVFLLARETYNTQWINWDKRNPAFIVQDGEREMLLDMLDCAALSL